MMWGVVFDVVSVVSILAIFFGFSWYYVWRKTVDDVKRKKVDTAMSIGMLFLMALFFISFFMAVREIDINELGL